MKWMEFKCLRIASTGICFPRDVGLYLYNAKDLVVNEKFQMLNLPLVFLTLI
jgi:hypothetical protein